jgi:hypothetical protein
MGVTILREFNQNEGAFLPHFEGKAMIFIDTARNRLNSAARREEAHERQSEPCARHGLAIERREKLGENSLLFPIFEQARAQRGICWRRFAARPS